MMLADGTLKKVISRLFEEVCCHFCIAFPHGIVRFSPIIERKSDKIFGKFSIDLVEFKKTPSKFEDII